MGLKLLANTRFRNVAVADIIAAAIILYACIPNRLFAHIRYGIDPSWQYALTTAVEKQYRFGLDFVFTYGPLGFLNFSLPPQGFIVAVLLYKAVLFVSLAALGISYVRRHPNPWDKLWCVLVFVLAGRLYYFDASIYFLVLFVTGIGYNSLRPQWWLILGLTAFAALNIFIKLNTAVMVLLLWALHLLQLTVAKKLKPGRAGLLLLLLVALVWAIAAITNTALIPYVQHGYAIVKDYSDAMVFPQPATAIMPLLAWIILGLFAVAMLSQTAWLRYRSELTVFLGLVLALFIAYKQGFVRGGGAHGLLFFSAAALLCVSLALSVPAMAHWRYLRHFQWLVLLLCILGNINIDRYGFPNRPLKDLYALETNPVVPISQSVLDKIGRQSIDLLPYNAMHLYFNRLNYLPRPDPQGYQAYSYWLDSLNAAFFAGQKAPAFVLIKPGSIDRHHPAWDEYRTKLTIRNAYSIMDSCRLPDYPVSAIPETYWLMARKPAGGAKVLVAKVSSTVQAIDAPVTCMGWGENDLLQIELEYNWLGSLINILYQPRQLHCITQYADGKADTFPAIRPILASGIPAGRRMVGDAAFRRFLAQEPPLEGDRIQNIRLEGDWAYFAPTMVVTRLAQLQ